jgi:Domain of unknown function (DUF4333)
MPEFARHLAVVGALVASMAFAACGTETLDNADLESQLTEQLSADAGVDPAQVSVSCPEDVEIEQGGEFECTLTAPNGDEVRVEVTMTDDEGNVDAVVPPQQFE